MQYIPFLSNVPFWSPWKHQRTRDSLMLAGVIKREHLDKKFGKLGINRLEPDSWSHIQQKKNWRAHNNDKHQRRSISSCFIDVCSINDQRLVPICFLIFWQSDFSLAQKYGLAQYLTANLQLIRFYPLSLFGCEM